MDIVASGTPLNRSDMSAGQLLIMAVVMTGLLAAWLIVVFLAARTRGPRKLRQAEAAPVEQSGQGTPPDPEPAALDDQHEPATDPVPVAADS
jgi:cytoskeletal protein RodZ